ncbi:MAG: alpha/beta fold hydrolase [Desulfuromonadales bacterium]|nr:alpha/beta fold hydrolase [Desulfuromonadales bacterium]
MLGPWRLWLFLLFAATSLAACGSGTRYIFSTSKELVATPQERGLAFEEVWFRADDGTRLHGWLLPGAPERPLVLFFHGNAANISHRVDNLQHLHGMGFPVFIFDYRGFGVSEGWPKSEADLAADARGALDWLAGRGWSPEGMIYFGRSMGAAVAVALAVDHPPAGIILEAPFTSLADMAKLMTPVTWALVGWWNIGDRFDNLRRLPHLHAPLLIFHGDRDAIVPLEMSQRLFAQANPPKSLHVVEGGAHSNSYLVGGEGYRRAWLDFATTLPLPSKTITTEK